MPNPYGAPEISTKDVAAKVAAAESFVWLDVREPDEVRTVSIDNDLVVNVPMSVLAKQQTAALPPAAQEKDAEIVVFCHHGTRSAQVAGYLAAQRGFTKIANMLGGIDEWSRLIDPSVPRY
jgi:rhodanese-related sulfurtransferase